MSRARKDARRRGKMVARVEAPPPPAIAPPPTARYLASDGALLRPVEQLASPWPDLSTMTVAQLRERARELGVPLGKARTKAAIIEALGG